MDLKQPGEHELFFIQGSYHPHLLAGGRDSPFNCIGKLPIVVCLWGMYSRFTYSLRKGENDERRYTER
jgi:hypothetical protein